MVKVWAIWSVWLGISLFTAILGYHGLLVGYFAGWIFTVAVALTIGVLIAKS